MRNTIKYVAEFKYDDKSVVGLRGEGAPATYYILFLIILSFQRYPTMWGPHAIFNKNMVNIIELRSSRIEECPYREFIEHVD